MEVNSSGRSRCNDVVAAGKKRAMVIQLLRCFLPSCYQLLLLTRSASAATSTAARSFRTFLPACVARDTRSNCSRDLSSRSDTCSL